MMQNLRKNNKGFTLVELMVAISIVAVLAAVGFTLFQNTQASARDAKRRADVDAMSSAMETHFDATTGKYPAAGSYPATLQTSWFTGQAVPADPLNASPYLYTADVPVNKGSYTICATLEKGGGNFTSISPLTAGSGNYYCKLSQQQ